MRMPGIALGALPLAGIVLFGAGATMAAGSSVGADTGRTGPGPAPCSAALLKGPYAVVGSGSLGGVNYNLIGSLVFDGKGGLVSGGGTGVPDRPVAVSRFTLSQGRYEIDETCSGKFRFFSKHQTLLPDYSHEVAMVVFDGGLQFALLNLTTELPGAPNVPLESFLLSGHRV